MARRSLFEEELQHRRGTVFFWGLGLVWMGLLGFLIAVAHLDFLNFLARSAVELRLPALDPAVVARWGSWGAAVAVVLWAGLAALFYFRSSGILPRLVGANPADPGSDRRLWRLAEEVFAAAGVAGQRINLFVWETPARNAFACGRSPENGSIVLTRGLIWDLDDEELRAVLAHEVAHLKNRDAAAVVQALAFAWMVVASTAAVLYLAALAGAMVALSAVLFIKLTEAVSEDSGEVEGCVTSLVGLAVALGFVVVAAVFLLVYLMMAGVVLGLAALGVKWAASSLSQEREFLADACAAQWTRNPLALASALAKVAGGPRLSPVARALLAPLLLSEGEDERDSWHRRLFQFLFRSHPPVAERVSRLREMAPAIEAGLWPVAVPRSGGRGAWFFDPVLGLAATLVALAIAWGYVWVAHPSASAPQGDRTPAKPRPVVAVVAEARVRLREGPSTESRIVRVLSRGTPVVVMHRHQDWCFVTVEEPALTGWIACRLLAFQ